jgi:hypothetical protein
MKYEKAHWDDLHRFGVRIEAFMEKAYKKES